MRRATILTALVLLAACDRGAQVSVENATPEEVAAEMKKSGVASELRRPGKWSSTVTIADVDAPGMPPQALDQMRQMMGNGRASERCVTAEELEKVDSFIGQNNANCRFDHYRVANGQVEGEARCSQGDVAQHLTMKGSYSADTSDMTIVSETSGKEPAQNMKMTMNIKSRRLGDCDANDGDQADTGGNQ